MPGPGWLAGQRTELAAEKILDAAGQLFADRDPASVGMHEIARAAGCSRATLYRYFDSRDALYTAYVHRWANALYLQLGDRLAGVADPGERLVAGITEAMALVRANPALASWFARTGPPIGVEMAERSEVVAAMVAGFLAELFPADDTTTQHRARWVVRVMTSLLSFPGRDLDDERAMLTQFVVPVVTASAQSRAQTIQ